MRKKTTFIFVGLIIGVWVYFYFHENGRYNFTEVGKFWYNDVKCDEICDSKYSYYKDTFKYNDYLIIHLIALRSDDKTIYHYGKAIFENDTLKLHIEELYKMSCIWNSTRTNCLTPIDFYFTSKVYPKAITLQFDYYRPFPLDSLRIKLR